MSNNGFNIDLIKIDEIVITNATIDNKTDFTVLEKENHYFNITFGFTPAVSLQQKKIRIIFSCQIKTSDKSEKEIPINGSFDIAYFFDIENFESLIAENNEIQVNPNLMLSLANITYSTSRGIIYTRCQGTILKKIILPILSTKELENILRVPSPSI